MQSLKKHDNLSCRKYTELEFKISSVTFLKLVNLKLN